MRYLTIERAAFGALTAVIVWLVLYPVLILAFETISTGEGGLNFQAWRSTLAMPILPQILSNTLVVSVVSTAVALLVAICFAFLIARTDIPMRSFLECISIAPFLTPPIVAGLAWQQLGERQSGLINLALRWLNPTWHIDIMTVMGITFVTALYLVPFMFLIVVNALRVINAELEEASTMCGAGRTWTLFHVTLPLMRPAISSAALLGFMYSNVLFGIHATLGMPVNIWFLTTAIYQSMNVIPAEAHRAAVLSCLLMAIAVSATYLQVRVMAGEKRFQTISGKGLRPRIVQLGPWRWIAWAICVGYVFLVTILPYLILFLRSLKPFMFLPGMTWANVVSGWDLRPYLAIILLRDDAITRSIWHSFALGAAGALIGVGLTAFAAYFATRSRIRAGRTFNILCMAPMALPGIVLGVAVLWGYSQRELMLYGTIWILLIAYVTKDLPLGFKSIQSSIVQVHPELDESSRTCGAGWLRQLGSITFPLVRPGLVIGGVLIFGSILTEIGASIILYSQGTEVVAYVLFNFWENGDYQALSAFIIITTSLTLFVAAVLLRFARLKFTDLSGSEHRFS